jgi:integrase
VASLHRDPRGRSPYFYCAFSLPDGKRAFRSTKQTDRKEALRVCIQWEKAAEAAAQGTMTEIQARKVLDDILESVGEGPIRTKTVGEFFLHWLAGRKLATAAGTNLHYKKAISKFLESLGPRADRSLTSISAGDVERFRDARMKCGISASTVKADLKVIRSVLSTARRQGLILHNPAESVDLPRSKSQERDVFTPAEVNALLAVTPLEWKTVVLLGYYVGARISDVISLKWDNVDLVQ